MAKNSHIPDFTRNRSQIHYLDPPAGLFVSHIKHPFKCDFVPFDSRIQSKNALWKTSSLLPPPRQLRISISCSLAMVCFCVLDRGGLTQLEPVQGLVSLLRSFLIKSAIYLNGALHWLQMAYFGLKHYKLNIKDHDHPILTFIQIGQGLHRGRNFFKPLGNNLQSCTAIQIGQRFHDEVKLFKSRGCLLVVIRDYYGSREFTIYEMRKGCFVWSVRCLVNTDDFMNPLLEGWLICSTVWSIVLGEREEDSCLVINLSGKVV
ncbi:hypothetical protein Tco_0747665 [Tanacetum coccineum]|uniref:Uncharacterized protein n=1 Tax=Tanacetum coccineum TaxID=301880 RepID=A0ABQ4YTC7_9ASTR